MNNILIATDLTSNSAHALDRAIQLAYTSGAKLHILHRVAAVGYHKSEKEEFLKRTEAKIQEMVSQNEYTKNMDISIHLAGRGRLHETIDE